MARVIATSSSRYNPITFDEMVKPLMMQEQAHQQAETNYLEMANKLSTIKNQINPEVDSELYNMYNELDNTLQSQASELSKNGLTNNVKNNIFNLRKAYIDKMVPVEQAIQARASDTERLNSMYDKDNSIMSNYDPRTSSLSSYIKNPNRRFDYISGKEVTSRIGAAIQNYKGLLTSQSKWEDTADGQLIQKIEQYGLTPAIIQEIRNNPEKHPAISNIINDVTSSYNIEDWDDRELVNEELIRRAYEGLNYGIGQTKTEIRNNADYLNPLQRLQYNKAKQEELDAYARRLKDVEYEADSDILITPNKVTEAKYEGKNLLNNGKINEDIASKYYNKEGKILSEDEFINKEKVEMLARAKQVGRSMNLNEEKIQSYLSDKYAEYNNSLKALGISNPEYMSKSELEDAINTINKGETNDAKFRQRSRLYINNTASEDLTGKILGAIGDGKLEEITGYKDGMYDWKYFDEDINKAIEDNKFKIIQTNSDLMSGELSFRALVDGKSKDFKLPLSVLQKPVRDNINKLTATLNSIMNDSKDYIRIGNDVVSKNDAIAYTRNQIQKQMAKAFEHFGVKKLN